jgi:hypothetical protein
MSKVDAKGKSGTTGFILFTAAIIFILFFIGHIGLVTIYRAGTTITTLAAVILAAAIVLLYIFRGKHRFFPLLTGFLIWAFAGEATEHLGYGDIVSIKNIFLIAGCTIFLIYLIQKRKINAYLSISLGEFQSVWVFHFIMVNQFEHLGKTHPVTYITCGVFAALLIFTIIQLIRIKDKFVLVLYTIVSVSVFWSILEYLWGWMWIPKPW